MPKINHDTREKILNAAETVFHKNGFKGARTTLIAKESGISRTMLHYYFNTKETLFQEVLRNSFGTFLIHASELFETPLSLKDLIWKLVDILCDVLEEKPGLPSFFINILNESPEILMDMPLIQQENLPAMFEKVLSTERQHNRVSPTLSGEDLVINIYGLCVMPYLGAPLVRLKENRGPEEMKEFFANRRASIKEFVWKGIQPGPIQ